MKYDIDSKVYVPKYDKYGKIKDYHYKFEYYSGEYSESIKYKIKFNDGSPSVWLEECKVLGKPVKSKIDELIIDAQIDYALRIRDENLFKYYSELKNKMVKE